MFVFDYNILRNFSCYFFRLTAFVVKSFAQASPFITIDEGAVLKAIDWMVLYQNENGSFREPGRVLHKAMQVGFVLLYILALGNDLNCCLVYLK